jgi:hypothetical protein
MFHAGHAIVVNQVIADVSEVTEGIRFGGNNVGTLKPLLHYFAEPIVPEKVDLLNPSLVGQLFGIALATQYVV